MPVGSGSACFPPNSRNTKRLGFSRNQQSCVQFQQSTGVTFTVGRTHGERVAGNNHCLFGRVKLGEDDRRRGYYVTEQSNSAQYST